MAQVKRIPRLWWHIQVWLRTRSLRLLLPALPAVLAGGAVLTLAGLCLLTPAHEVEASYLEQGKDAFKARDYAAALTCFDRLAHLGQERPEILYRLALTVEALGQGERAAMLMAELAPANRPGYGPAHLWRAGRELMKPNPSARDRALAEAHLLQALDGELEDRDVAHALLGKLYLARGQLVEAQQHLLRAVKTRPHLRLNLAQLYARRGDRERARREADLAIGYFRARAKADLYEHRFRLLWAEATAFVEDFPGAVAILEEGLSATGARDYRTALAGVYVTWHDFLSRDRKVKLEEQLALLERGLHHDPANLGVLNRLLAAIKVHGDRADRARAALRGLLARGKVPAPVHFALGVDAWERGQAAEARVHWERAYQLDPLVPVVGNNLAWLLAHSKPPDLPRALKMINLVIEHSPRNLEFRETRGQILARMGRWKEALADLEAVLPRSPSNPKLHAALADVYRHLGVPAMAAEHERLASKKNRGQGSGVRSQ
jgi:tetratricopeptide (TPR) repeat protein